MESQYKELTYYEAITNKDILDEKSIIKYLIAFRKNNGNLQKNLRDIIISKYQLVFQDVEWFGRGKNRTLKIGKNILLPK